MQMHTATDLSEKTQKPTIKTDVFNRLKRGTITDFLSTNSSLSYKEFHSYRI